MLKQMPTWKRAVFGILAIALVLAAFLFSKVKADGGGTSSPYDANIVGDWQISSIVGSGDVPEQYLDTSYLAQVTVKDDHTGVMQYGPQQVPFHWKYSESYDDGSIGYMMSFDDGHLIGAILVGDNSEDFHDYRGMLGINIVDDAMMAFVRMQNSEQTMQAA